MKVSLEARMERAAALLNADGSVTPPADLPAGLLVPESEAGFVAEVQSGVDR